jgi:hypothetical protein
VSLLQKRADALLVSPDPLLDSRRVQLITLAAHHRLPTIYPFRENVEIGGLMSYGSSAADWDREVGIYTGRILKGEKPADPANRKGPRPLHAGYSRSPTSDRIVALFAAVHMSLPGTFRPIVALQHHGSDWG